MYIHKYSYLIYQSKQLVLKNSLYIPFHIRNGKEKKEKEKKTDNVFYLLVYLCFAFLGSFCTFSSQLHISSTF